MHRIDRFIEAALENRERRLRNEVNSIFWDIPSFTNLDFPGWVRGKYYGITALPSVGKTVLAKYLILYSVYKQWVENPSFDFRIFWVALEESEEDFYNSIICFSIFMSTKGKVKLFPSLLTGRTKRLLTDEEMNHVINAKNSLFVQTMFDKIDLITNISNPTGVLKHLEHYFDNPDLGEKLRNEEGHFLSFKHKSDNHYHFLVVDHISNFSAEMDKGVKMTQHATLHKYSVEYVLGKLTRKYGMIVVNVHQQDAQKAKMEYYRGSPIEETLLPSEDHLANNKELQRDYDVLIGLYSPFHHNIESHTFGIEYRLPRFNDGQSFRWVNFLKDRLAGLTGTKTPLYFEGSTFYFEQLPNYKKIKSQQDRLENYPKYKI